MAASKWVPGWTACQCAICHTTTQRNPAHIVAPGWFKRDVMDKAGWWVRTVDLCGQTCLGTWERGHAALGVRQLPLGGA